MFCLMGIFWGSTGMRTKVGKAQKTVPAALLWLTPEQTKVSYCKTGEIWLELPKSYATTTQAHFCFVCFMRSCVLLQQLSWLMWLMGTLELKGLILVYKMTQMNWALLYLVKSYNHFTFFLTMIEIKWPKSNLSFVEDLIWACMLVVPLNVIIYITTRWRKSTVQNYHCCSEAGILCFPSHHLSCIIITSQQS